jgi:MoaA/NifB/PqqE/SkfB family radical SAM enzyme
VQLPRFVQIEPVGLCNLRCRMCPIQLRVDANDGSPSFMDYGTFYRLVDQFPELDELFLQGLGEPLLHSRFFDMVRYAARRGVALERARQQSRAESRPGQERPRAQAVI